MSKKQDKLADTVSGGGSEAEAPRKRVWPGDHVVDIDLRSMALVRVAMALILFADTAIRMTDIPAMYTDWGSLSRASLLELGWNPYWFSLHMGTGVANGIAVLMTLQLLCAVGLLLGWRTRQMTFWSWLFLISVHSRNPMVLNGGDIYLRVVLFWMLFLPWGQTWSLDARAGRSDTRWWTPSLSENGKAVRSLAGIGVLFQISAVYWFAALPKTDPAWTSTYTATSLALMLDTFITPFGKFFRETFWNWLPTMTFLVIRWEFYGPWLWWFPFDKGQMRTLGVLGFIGMHTGFGTCMELGLFAWIGVCMPLVLLPAWFWEKPARKLTAYWDSKAATRWVDPHPYGQESPLRWFPREFFYYAVIFYTLLWNMGNENLSPNLRLPANSQWFGQMTRLDQRWNMFSPGPLTEDGWFVIEGTRRDGSKVDMWTPGAPETVSFEKPEWIAYTFPNERWRKYMMNLWMADNSRYRLPLGQYLTRKFNSKARGPREVVEFKIYYMKEVTNPDGSEQPPEKVMIWHHWCFDEPRLDKGKGVGDVEAKPLKEEAQAKKPGPPRTEPLNWGSTPSSPTPSPTPIRR